MAIFAAVSIVDVVAVDAAAMVVIVMLSVDHKVVLIKIHGLYNC